MSDDRTYVKSTLGKRPKGTRRNGIVVSDQTTSIRFRFHPRLLNSYKKDVIWINAHEPLDESI